MFSNGKIVGLVLIGAGVAIALVATAFMGVGYSTGSTGPAGAALGVVICGLLPLIAFGGVGGYLFVTGKKEEAELVVIRKKERLLGLIQAQGKASVGPIMMEMEMTRDQVTEAIYELVAMGLFSGYIDWDTLTFYSEDAAAVGSNQCPNCGGIRELVGKGIVKCQYCGVGLFIPPDAEQTRAEPKPPKENA
ncbi:MAG TPA: hypothetical protein VMN57_11175 [Anaerolineales bacterium]|nr:hypothetical protein [Anaerolineales bacterium]